MHSKKRKAHYDSGLWGVTAVRNAVIERWTTAEKYGKITGKPYEDGV